MPLPISYWTNTLSDNTRKSNGEPEVTTLRVPIITLTPANVAATETLTGNLATAIAAITLGANNQRALTYNVTQFEKIPAATPQAQRENKWLVRFHDDTTFQKSTVSIGTADLAELAGNSEFLVLTAGNGLAFKTAFEAVVVSPYDSANGVIVDSVQFVGRNT